MQPRDRAILALERKQPDVVPHFELEMQLTEEYFGKSFSTREQWEAASVNKTDLLKKDAELFIQIAEKFNYAIIFYSGQYCPDQASFLEGIRVLREMDGGKRLIMAHGDSTLSIPDGTNMVDHAFTLFDQPDLVKAQQTQAKDEALELGQTALAAGLDGFILCADYCFNDGPFLSPNMFAEFVTPYLTALIQGYRQMGAYVIKHTDGDIMPIIDQLVAANPHALHSLDPMAGVDIKEIKQRYGHQIALVGNVNCALMQTGSDDEIRENCRYAIENGKPGGGYIYSTSNVIFKGMPQRSYDIMLECYEEYKYYQET